MMKRRFILSILAAALAIPASLAIAADTAKSMPQEQIYGSQLMTPEERAEHQVRMRTAKTAEEREQIRKEHHERMTARAKERGVTLPDEPPARSTSMMPGGRVGPGGSQSPIFGSQLMTPEERAEHQARMRTAKTAEEREQIRKEHHERMTARAKERGVTLPDEPPVRGSRRMPGGGMGPSGGMGGGMSGGRSR